MSYQPRKKSARPQQKLNKNMFQRKKNWPFSGKSPLVIDYKDSTLLRKFLTEQGRVMPRRITNATFSKQRELALAIKRARYLALIPYVIK